MAHNILECLYCSKPITSSQAADYTCNACRRKHIAEFGPDWNQQPWHRELVGQYATFCWHDERLQDAGVLSIESDAPAITESDVTEPCASLATDLPVKHPEILSLVSAMYRDEGVGCREIKRRLDRAGVKPCLTERTIARYIAIVREHVGGARG